MHARGDLEVVLLFCQHVHSPVLAGDPKTNANAISLGIEGGHLGCVVPLWELSVGHLAYRRAGVVAGPKAIMQVRMTIFHFVCVPPSVIHGHSCRFLGQP